MKKIKKLLLEVIILTATLSIATSAMAGGEMKLALDCPPDPDKCGTYFWSKTFSDYLETKGQKVKLYPRDALGGEAEKLDQVSQGLLEISNSDLAKAGSLDPTIFGFYLPFLFEDMDHFFRILNNTDLLAKVNAGLTKHGVRVMAVVPLGAMGGFATTKKFIKIPADFAGVRMRALDNKQAKWFEIWGANAVVIPWSEIYNALQTGIADGYLNPAFVPIMFKHTEVLKYYSDVKVLPGLRVALCSEEWYQGLSTSDRGLVDEGVAKANAAIQKWSKKVEAESLDALRKAGVEVYVNTAAEKTKFAELIRPLYKEIVDPKIAEMFVEAAEKNR
ncbi:MAG: TRAP transporter substrate-binding protein [Desulfobacterales bacterium]|nr:MAG: TRAP transporter substrate-binding protein [Desulfobacterales bacterium]